MVEYSGNTTPAGYGSDDGLGYIFSVDSANSPNARTSASTDGETRPVNVAVTFCEYTGGAPLITTPSGGAGEVQFAGGRPAPASCSSEPAPYLGPTAGAGSGGQGGPVLWRAFRLWRGRRGDVSDGLGGQAWHQCRSAWHNML